MIYNETVLCQTWNLQSYEQNWHHFWQRCKTHFRNNQFWRSLGLRSRQCNKGRLWQRSMWNGILPWLHSNLWITAWSSYGIYTDINICIFILHNVYCWRAKVPPLRRFFKIWNYRQRERDIEGWQRDADHGISWSVNPRWRLEVNFRRKSILALKLNLCETSNSIFDLWLFFRGLESFFC